MANPRVLTLCTMRNEGPYILEWLAYHRAIGLSEFLIYTNDCNDGTDLLLDRLEHNGILTHVRNKVLKRGPQKSAYKAAMSHPAYLNADWILVIDVDEFLNIHVGNHNAIDLINHFPEADVIPVGWKLFSNNNREHLLDNLTIEALTDAEPATPKAGESARFVKSLFRPNEEISRIGSHTPIYSETFENKVVWGAEWHNSGSDEKPDRPNSADDFNIAQINHYAVRTVDSFLLKRERGDVNFMKDRLEFQYWNRWCKGGEEDHSIQKHLPTVSAEIDQLLADPIVRSLHNASKEVHELGLKSILERSDVKKLKDEIIQSTGTTPSLTSPIAVNPYTDALKLKAPGRHQNRVRLLEKMPKNARCAEIGVWNGGFSDVILEVTKPAELILIDPWEKLAEQSPEEWTHNKHQDHQFMQKMHNHVVSCYHHLSNVSIRCGFSSDILSSFPDKYFDWVYIDGNHQYDFVREDVKLAFKKVRHGGIIAGDDFFWKRNGRMHVKEAVLDEMRSQGMSNRPTRFGQQFMITVTA